MMEKIIKNILNCESCQIKNKTIDSYNGISSGIALKKQGLSAFEVIESNSEIKNMVVKHKNNKIILRGIKVLAAGNVLTRMILILNHKVLGYNQSYKRETFVYENIDDSLRSCFFKYYGSYKKLLDYYIGLEYVDIRNSIDYKKVLDAILNIHAFYYNDIKCVEKFRLNDYKPKDYKKCKLSLKRMFNSLNNELFIEERIRNIDKFIRNIDKYYSKYLYHRTFTHNDLDMRNIFVNENSIFIYDWELACFQNPEHDLIEFLISISANYSDREIEDIIEYYRENLFKKINVKIDDEEYKEILIFNIYEFIVNKLSLLRLAGKNIINTDELIRNANKLLDILGDIKYE